MKDITAIRGSCSCTRNPGTTFYIYFTGLGTFRRTAREAAGENVSKAPTVQLKVNSQVQRIRLPGATHFKNNSQSRMRRREHLIQERGGQGQGHPETMVTGVLPPHPNTTSETLRVV